MTMNAHWGWNKADDKWKSTSDLIRKLIDIASKGGNFLLNIGPRPDGTFPDQAIERLEGIGHWMDINHAAIYGTSASPFKQQLPWGRCTQRLTKDGAILYLHVFDWPANGKLVVPGLANDVKSASLLADNRKLTSASTPDGLELTMPATAPDTISTTVVLKIKGAPQIK